MRDLYERPVILVKTFKMGHTCFSSKSIGKYWIFLTVNLGHSFGSQYVFPSRWVTHVFLQNILENIGYF